MMRKYLDTLDSQESDKDEIDLSLADSERSLVLSDWRYGFENQYFDEFMHAWEQDKARENEDLVHCDLLGSGSDSYSAHSSVDILNIRVSQICLGNRILVMINQFFLSIQILRCQLTVTTVKLFRKNKPK